ncbi:hypothetical protein [Palleronia sp.]|uniref:hypothetical protein n=1 Tax=Palleronia sp. TaxID=1940284 RepID=UPI0035C84B52
MSRNNPRDSIQDVVARAYRAAGGIENVSADLGLSIGTLSEHTGLPKGKRAGGLGINYADTLSRIHPEVAAVYAAHFAALAGGTFTAADEAAPLETVEHLSRIAKESAEGLTALARIEHGGSKADALEQLADIHRVVGEAIRDLAIAPVTSLADRRAS